MHSAGLSLAFIVCVGIFVAIFDDVDLSRLPHPQEMWKPLAIVMAMIGTAFLMLAWR